MVFSKRVLRFFFYGIFGVTIGHSTLYAQIANFTSPNGVVEQCIAIQPIPEGVYSESDHKQESKLCSINFYAPQISICGKQKSTSPGTYIFDLTKTNLTQEQAEQKCTPTDMKGDKLATYKQTMNQKDTSGTFAMSSLLYYHLSRYFETSLIVPPSVYRTMDKDSHFQRVSQKTVGRGPMNKAGWKHLQEAEKSPETYNEKTRLFTIDLKQIYGSMLSSKGEVYGSYFFGTRESGWQNQYFDFKKTPIFMTLKNPKSFNESFSEGLTALQQSRKMSSEIGNLPSLAQMHLWVQSTVEMLIMDFIFSQQDRIGNIDFIWSWAYLQGATLNYVNLEKEFRSLSRVQMVKQNLKPPVITANLNPVLIQRTIINDNDAGGLSQYNNFTKQFRLLEDVRHLNAQLYLKLINLAKDFNSHGPIYNYVQTNFVLAKKDFESIGLNIQLASEILKKSCHAKNLHFDVDFAKFLNSNGVVTEESVICD